MSQNDNKLSQCCQDGPSWHEKKQSYWISLAKQVTRNWATMQKGSIQQLKQTQWQQTQTRLRFSVLLCLSLYQQGLPRLCAVQQSSRRSRVRSMGYKLKQKRFRPELSFLPMKIVRQWCWLCIGRLCNFHPWGFSKSNWTKPWETSFEQGVGLETP